MKTLLLIGAGGFAGSILRYLLAQAVQMRAMTTFPYGTLAVNLIGCFCIGAVFALSERGYLNQEMRLFLATGLLGGFTTFSAFSNETIGMMREGQWGSAAVYVAGSLLLSLAATFTGYSFIKTL